MDYSGKRVALTGADGFIGWALKDRLSKLGAEVIVLRGDTRMKETFDPIDFSYDYIFHFAAPSSQVLFKREPAYCIESTLKGFMNAASAAKMHGVRLVYPSTGLLSMISNPEDKDHPELVSAIKAIDDNLYARCKRICEDWALGNAMDSIGLRIFATYGPGEGHKRDYASVPYLFARDMANGKSPVIFGDGGQVRDFIYIDDTVEAIVTLAELCGDSIVDIGSGEQISFNAIVDIINDILGTDISATYVDKPGGYVNETSADPAALRRFYIPRTDMAAGLRSVIVEVKE